MSSDHVQKQEKRSRVKFGVKAKMVVGFLIPLAIVLIFSGIQIKNKVSDVVTSLDAKYLTAEANRAAREVDAYFERYYGIVQTIAVSDSIQQALNGWNVNAYHGTQLEQDTLTRLRNLINMDANIKHIWLCNCLNQQVTQSDGSFLQKPGFDPTTRQWYQEVTNKRSTIVTGVYSDEATGEMIVSVATPVYTNQTLAGIAGLDVTVDSLIKKLAEIQIGKEGYLTVFDTNDTIVYHPDQSIVMTNAEENNYSDNILQAILNNQQVEGVSYTRANNEYYGATIYLENMDYMVLGIMPADEFQGYVVSAKNIIYINFVIGFLLLSTILIVFGQFMTKSVRRLSAAATRIANGELSVTVDVKGSDEIALLANDIRSIVNRLEVYILYIDEISEVLDEIGKGNFNFQMQQDYTGEFVRIKNSLLSVQNIMSNTMRAVITAASQVNAGAEQISIGATTQAQGVTEQASSVEQLSAALADISREIQANTHSIEAVDDEMQQVVQEINSSDEKMKSMLVAMSEITQHSVEIEKIIKEIEDIAFQTNILALNAAVEAARAGVAGKGFAVVADEVRSLASKTAEASKDTAELIDQSLRAVQNGKRIADETAASFHKVYQGVTKVASNAGEIADNSERQNKAIQQTTIGVDQISAVIQSSAGVSEQSAAASEELAGQARALEEMVSHFRLLSDDKKQ